MRTIARDGVCVACGWVGGPQCDTRPRCNAGAAPGSTFGPCVAAGGKDQPCLEGDVCGYDGMFCDASKTCRVCGGPGQPCCPPQPQLGGGTLKECYAASLQCNPVGGGRICQYVPGTAPERQPPARPPTVRTCGGNEYQLGVTTTYPVWIRLATGCASLATSYAANSPQEALQCAKAAFGDLVITSTVLEYEYSMNGPLGCRTHQVYATDTDDAEMCVQSLCTNCDPPFEGKCP
jgi:hypothetical protein